MPNATRWDVALYGSCAVFTAGLGVFTGLATHQAWAQMAMVGYAVAALVAFVQLLAGTGALARSLLAAGTWVGTAVVPMLLLVGRPGEWAQEEVRVVERAAARWLDTGSPYLGRDAIAALPAGDRLEAYTPYQPAMAVFGVPRALDPVAWWADARVWFAVVTVAVLAGALALLGGHRLRAWQAAVVVPTAALATAVGGDDLPVLALCLLALALAARGRLAAAGLAAGAAAALKLIAWPVALVLGVYAATRGGLTRYGIGALGVPLLTLLPAVAADPGAVVENTVRFPLGAGLVASPADAPLLGHLVASLLPGGEAIAVGLLAGAGIGFAAWLVRRPPRTAAAAAAICGAGLLVAMVLMPATRFGYLLYPLALLAWVPALGVARREARAHESLPGRHERLPAAAGRH